MIGSETRERVRQRAGNRCEYCLIRQVHSDLTHHVEHIVARQHGGSDDPSNLALACHRCNLRKGPNLTGVDPFSNQVVRLFDPRRDGWSDHFRVFGVRIVGNTPTGRATVEVLVLNDVRRLDLRQELSIRGEFA